MTDAEYSAVTALLDREPMPAELAMYSLMWSEHCSYKSSRLHLKRLPSDAPWVVVGPGENAGVVDLGDGWLAALRIESHNHPSFVEPREGAATGVGGILRDVLTMGARPIALWDQIRFGPLDDAHNRYLFDGVVQGIAAYGNAVGVPTVGGEIEFDDRYAGNPLVNVMCLGVMKREQLVTRAASGAGNLAVLLGGSTGRDGIGGASILASASFNAGDEEKRPSVQVGDPFTEKKVIEACLELFDRHLVVAIQDLGAAGIACAASEVAAAGGMGIDLDLDAVPVRERGMTAAELLVSESQERMLAIVEPGRLAEVLEVTDRWEIDAAVIGVLRSGGTMRAHLGGELAAEVPAASLADAAPLYDRPMQRPSGLDESWATPPPPPPEDPAVELLALLDDPALGDPSWIYRQYDHMLLLGSIVGPGHDASLLRIAGTSKAMAVSTDGGGRRCTLDPRRGAERLVWEAALNVAVTGARPLAVVDNLNAGNAENPKVMWALSETIDGIASACVDVGVPVVGGNVSLYNATAGVDVHPTPVIGLLGLADPHPDPPPRLDRASDGDAIWLIGPPGDGDIAGSAWERVIHQRLAGRPAPADPAAGHAAIEAAIGLAEICPVLHDISLGGLAVAAAEIAFHSSTGIALDEGLDWFGESPHRLLAVVPIGAEGAAATVLDAVGAQHRSVGAMGGDFLRLGSLSLALGDAMAVWRNAIPRRMGEGG